MKNPGTLNVLIWANKSKIDSNNQIPLYARITLHTQRAEVSLNIRIDSNKWDSQIGFLKGNTQEIMRINEEIINAKNNISRAHTELKRTESFITAEMVKLKYFGKEKPQRMLLEVFDEHNAKMEELVGKGIVKGTLKKYETIRAKVYDYIVYKFKKRDIYLTELEYSFITGFEHYLKAHQSIGHNAVMGYIKRVKRVVNIAVENRWLSMNPFKGFVCTTKKTNRTELRAEEIKTLENKVFEVSRLEEVRDCYLFSCYTGYAFVDAHKLTPKNVVKGDDGEMWIETDRTKSNIEANVPLLPQAIAIVERYKNHPFCVYNNRLLPMKSNQKMNAYLKEIASLCGIEKNLTTHTARHTFATTITLENDVPIETVSKMLGHTKITTTQIYARVQKKKNSADMKKLKDKLEKKV